MIYRNFDLHGVFEIAENADGTVSWLRMPRKVSDKLDKDSSRDQIKSATGVELRFVIRSGNSATVKMKRPGDGRSYGLFHVYRGGVQGGWQDHEADKITDTEMHSYVIPRATNTSELQAITNESGTSFSPEVVRLIFDRGAVQILEVEGDVCPPTPDMLPERTLLTYGSSITHGSNSLTASHSWPSLLAHELDTDLLNLGLAGSCLMEPEVADFIAKLGTEGKWDIGVFELGINTKDWSEQKARTRVEYFLNTVVRANPEKPIFVISPFYHAADHFALPSDAPMWRRILPDAVAALDSANVKFINGTDVLGSMKYISGDGIHPSIYGVYRIAERLTEIIGGKSFNK